MSDTLYYVLSAVLSLGVLLGIRWMSKVETAVRGNRLSALCMLIAVILVFIKAQLLPDWLIWVGLAIGTVLGIVMAQRAKMITMPQMVALLNGLGGAASALAALITLTTTTTALVDTVVRWCGPARRFGVDPERIGLLLHLGLRCVPLVAGLAGQVREAQIARGNATSLRAFAVPLLVRALRQADALGEALVARGVDD